MYQISEHLVLWEGSVTILWYFVNEVKNVLFEQTLFYVTLILLFCQNPQPRRLQDSCERLEGGQDGVAHEDVGLRLDALEGGHRGHLRLQEAPQRMRTPQLSDPLQSEHQIILTPKIDISFLKQCFIGASILPDLHSCRRSSQEKADALNCSGPDPKHNTGFLNSSILGEMALN